MHFRFISTPLVQLEALCDGDKREKERKSSLVPEPLEVSAVPSDSERGGSPAFGAAASASASRIGSLAGAAAASPPSPSGSILSLSFSRSLLGMRGQESTKRTRGERREGDGREKERKGERSFCFSIYPKAPPRSKAKRKSDFFLSFFKPL